jgi:hypothetical protein
MKLNSFLQETGLRTEDIENCRNFLYKNNIFTPEQLISTSPKILLDLREKLPPVQKFWLTRIHRMSEAKHSIPEDRCCNGNCNSEELFSLKSDQICFKLHGGAFGSKLIFPPLTSVLKWARDRVPNSSIPKDLEHDAGAELCFPPNLGYTIPGLDENVKMQKEIIFILTYILKLKPDI